MNGNQAEWHTLASELEHGPSTEAESDYAELLEPVFLLQRFGAAFDLREADRLGVTIAPRREIVAALFDIL